MLKNLSIKGLIVSIAIYYISALILGGFVVSPLARMFLNTKCETMTSAECASLMSGTFGVLFWCLFATTLVCTYFSYAVFKTWVKTDLPKNTTFYAILYVAVGALDGFTLQNLIFNASGLAVIALSYYFYGKGSLNDMATEGSGTDI